MADRLIGGAYEAQDPAQHHGFDFNTYVDDQGRPFVWLGGKAGTQRIYQSPATMGDHSWQLPGNDFLGSYGWNQNTGRVEHQFDGTKLMTTAMLGLGGAAAAPAVFGAGGASAVPTYGPTLSQAGLTEGALAPAAAGGNFAADAVGTTASHFGGAGGSGLTSALTSKLGQKAIGLGLGAASGIAGRGNTSMSPEAQQMLAEALRRMMATGPLFDNVNRMTQAGLPGYAKGGQ